MVAGGGDRFFALFGSMDSAISIACDTSARSRVLWSKGFAFVDATTAGRRDCRSDGLGAVDAEGDGEDDGDAAEEAGGDREQGGGDGSEPEQGGGDQCG